MRSMAKVMAAAGTAAGLAILWLPGPPLTAQPDTFAARIASLSESPGYFDTDNLISNERSYLHVAGALEASATAGGAYIGVGPDQNFSYVALTRPALAVIVDIRRDNMLLHLLFKALFEMSDTRVEYLSLLTGRSPPGSIDGWRGEPVDRVVRSVDQAPPLSSTARAELDTRVTTAVRRFGVPLSDQDVVTIRRFHGRFMADGLSLRFNSTGRAPQWDYPTYRDLLLETDRGGRQKSYLASEEAFQFVKSLQARDLVIPVVGDLAGPKALRAVGTFLAERNLKVGALYASNVEFYLFGEGRFAGFVANLGRLPIADSAVIVRSVFRGGSRRVPGYNSASVTQPLGALVEGYAKGRFRWYGELLDASR